jgi:hypothetical protein
MMPQKFLTREQTNYIQGRLKMLGENTVSLAARLRLPWSTVAGTINGNRANPQARQGIADFLGEPVEKLFGGADLRLETGATENEVSHG